MCASTHTAGANVNAMVQIWHSANWEAKTALGFAVYVDTVDTVQLLLHHGVQVDHMSLSKCTNPGLCKLLKVAGDASFADTNTSEYVRIENGKSLKRHMLRTLSDQCRRLIRRHLLEVNLEASLFHTVRYLALPIPLQEYLVFGVTLKCPSISCERSQGLCEQMLVFYRSISSDPVFQ